MFQDMGTSHQEVDVIMVIDARIACTEAADFSDVASFNIDVSFEETNHTVEE